MTGRQVTQPFQAVRRPDGGNDDERDVVLNAMVDQSPAVIARYAGVIAGIIAVATIGVIGWKLRTLYGILSDH